MSSSNTSSSSKKSEPKSKSNYLRVLDEDQWTDVPSLDLTDPTEEARKEAREEAILQSRIYIEPQDKPRLYSNSSGSKFYLNPPNWRVRLGRMKICIYEALYINPATSDFYVHRPDRNIRYGKVESCTYPQVQYARSEKSHHINEELATETPDLSTLNPGDQSAASSIYELDATPCQERRPAEEKQVVERPPTPEDGDSHLLPEEIPEFIRHVLEKNAEAQLDHGNGARWPHPEDSYNLIEFILATGAETQRKLGQASRWLYPEDMAELIRYLLQKGVDGKLRLLPDYMPLFIKLVLEEGAKGRLICEVTREQVVAGDMPEFMKIVVEGQPLRHNSIMDKGLKESLFLMLDGNRDGVDGVNGVGAEI